MDARDRTEIERLYLKMYAVMFEYARCSLSNDPLAEEAVQDTFIIACQKAAALRASPSPEGWLMNTLKNVISNTLRTQNAARRVLLQYSAANASGVTASADTLGLELSYGDLAELEEFKLLREMAIEGRSYLEMARERGITAAACRKRVQRAKETLRKKIQI